MIPQVDMNVFDGKGGLFIFYLAPWKCKMAALWDDLSHPQSFPRFIMRTVLLLMIHLDSWCAINNKLFGNTLWNPFKKDVHFSKTQWMKNRSVWLFFITSKSDVWKDHSMFRQDTLQKVNCTSLCTRSNTTLKFVHIHLTLNTLHFTHSNVLCASFYG